MSSKDDAVQALAEWTGHGSTRWAPTDPESTRQFIGALAHIAHEHNEHHPLRKEPETPAMKINLHARIAAIAACLWLTALGLWPLVSGPRSELTTGVDLVNSFVRMGALVAAVGIIASVFLHYVDPDPGEGRHFQIIEDDEPEIS